MNKLEEIKQLVSVLQDPGSSYDEFTKANDEMEDNYSEYILHLLSLIEEKDKALEQFTNEYNWIDIWDPGLESCKKEWAPIENPIEIATKALRGE